MTYSLAALTALSDPTRREILDRLRAGPRAVGEIAAGLPISRPAVSQHLKALKEGGLVAERREGTRHYFVIAPDGIGELRAYLDGLWSDALAAFARHGEGASAMSESEPAQFIVPPVEKSVLVACTPARAFQAFTAEIAQWWPLRTHSVGQAKARSVRIEPNVGGRIYETSEDGSTSEWGRVLTWSPPAGFSMTWHPGRPANPHTVVELTFTAEGDATRVRLVHRGWEALGKEARARRDDYNGGWGKIMAQDFGRYLGRAG